MMVVHVGIDPHIVETFAYDTSNKNFDYYSISPVEKWKHDGQINKMFYGILSRGINELGCACMILPYSFPYKFRSRIVRFGLENGFKKVQFTDLPTSLLYELFSFYNPKFYDVILICLHSRAYIWKKNNKIFERIGSYIFDEEKIEHDIKKIIQKNPDVIFYQKRLPLEKFKDVFPESEYLLIEWQNVLYGAVYKELTTEGVADNLHYNIANHFNGHMTVTLNKTEIMDIDYHTILPYKKMFEIDASKIKYTLVLTDECNNYKEEYLLPEFKMLLIIKIDLNGIFSITCANLSEKNETKMYAGTKRAVKHFEVYTFPKKVQINNEQVNAVGIDLGTTRCCAAVNRRNGIETVALENTGGRLLPSWVAFDEEKEKCGQIVIDRFRNHAKSSVFDIKRIIGKTFDKLKTDSSWPFETLNCYVLRPVSDVHKANFGGMILIKLHAETDICVKSPEEISAVLLKHIKCKVEEFQGKSLNEVVITIPAAFNEAQKQATHDSAIIAGWKNVHLFPEPIAAAFAYFVDRTIPNNSKFESNLLLFDLGGGTLDVCIFKIRKNKLQIISRSGDPQLGGRDFDNLLIQHLEKILVVDHSVTMTESKKYKLLLKCQNIKENLSINEEDFLDAEEIDTSIDENIFINITRNEFEAMSAALLQQIRKNIEAALRKTDFKMNEMNQVLHVGGGCRMPMIKNLLHEMFPHAEHCCEKNPDEVVAIGAAYYAYNLNRKDKSTCSLI